jgi:signal transduction histidine kinase
VVNAPTDVAGRAILDARSRRDLLGVINDILDFSKIESGHMEVEAVDFDLVEVVEDALALVAQPAEGLPPLLGTSTQWVVLDGGVPTYRISLATAIFFSTSAANPRRGCRCRHRARLRLAELNHRGSSFHIRRRSLAAHVVDRELRCNHDNLGAAQQVVGHLARMAPPPWRSAHGPRFRLDSADAGVYVGAD